MTIDATRYPATASGTRAPIWLGQFGMMVIEGVLFAVLLVVYFYVKFSMDVWPPPGPDRPDAVLPTVNLLILLASCIPMYLAGEASKKKHWNAVVVWTFVNVAMALVFLVLRTWELNRLEFKWTSDIFGSIVWCVMGLHTMHAATDTVESTMIGLFIARGWRGEKQQQAVEVDGLYWYFVAAIWVPFYFIFFLFR